MQRECVNSVREGSEISSCPNMKRKVGDLSMDYEYYECEVCGKTDKLCYDEMR